MKRILADTTIAPLGVSGPHHGKKRGVFEFALALILSLCLSSCPAFAAPPSAAASLSEPAISAGDSTQLTLSVRDAGGLAGIPQIKVDGLRIDFQGQSMQTRIENFTASQSLDLSYEVSADTPGSFSIPSIELRTEKGLLKTDPLQLVVRPSNAQGSQQSQAQTTFAEIRLTKQTAYIGETLPAEMRLYVDSRVRWEPEQRPSLEGEGFTRLKMPNPTVEKEQRNGILYDVLIFRTAISPGKAGKLNIGPSEVKFRAEAPQRRSKAGNGLDGFLGQFFSNTQVRSYTAKANAVELEVKPLPIEGRPADFSGAVGVFTLQAEASPAKVKLGDPITLRMTLSGRGNFDRVTAPVLGNLDGWHAYPAKGEFHQEEELGISGRKLFEMALLPERIQTHLPEIRFSYFNPETRTYETLQNAPTQIAVEGGAAPTSHLQPALPAAVAGPTAPTSAPAPSPSTEGFPSGIRGPRYDFGAPIIALTPVSVPRSLLWAQIAPATLLAAVWIRRLLRPTEARRTRAQLQDELAQINSQLQSEETRASFYNLATRRIQIEASFLTGLPDATVDLDSLKRSLKMPALILASIEPIFESRNELLYAGDRPSGTKGSLGEAERERCLQALHQFSQSHVRH
jgi:hypothetical protein